MSVAAFVVVGLFFIEIEFSLVDCGLFERFPITL